MKLITLDKRHRLYSDFKYALRFPTYDKQVSDIVQDIRQKARGLTFPSFVWPHEVGAFDNVDVYDAYSANNKYYMIYIKGDSQLTMMQLTGCI